MEDALRLAGAIVVFLAPLIAERYRTPISPRVWPLVTALCAGLSAVVAVTWSPLQPLLLTMDKTPATILVALIGAIVVGGSYAAARYREEQRVAADPAHAPLPLAVSVTGIQSGPWDSAKMVGTDTVVHGWRVILTPVRITNRSPSNRVNLRFRLRLDLVQNERGNKSWEAEAMVRGLDAAGKPEPSHFPGPLDLAPQTTQSFSLMATVMPGAELVFGRMELRHRGEHILTIEDLVSGKTLNLRVPTSMGGVVFRAR